MAYDGKNRFALLFVKNSLSKTEYLYIIYIHIYTYIYILYIYIIFIYIYIYIYINFDERKLSSCLLVTFSQVIR